MYVPFLEHTKIADKCVMVKKDMCAIESLNFQDEVYYFTNIKIK